MSFPLNITKSHLLKAIKKIDEEGIPSGGDSRYYDVDYKGKKYPPKLIVSYANLFANDEILDRNTFNGGINTPCFNLLSENGFSIIPKNPSTMNSVKVYDIKNNPDIQHNSQILISPDNTNFYWNDKTFKKDELGDYVFVVNQSAGWILFTRYAEKNILADFDKKSKISRFEHLGHKYEVIDPDYRYKNFCRFEIISKVVLPKEWRWEIPLRSSEQLYLWSDEIVGVQKRLSRVYDLMKVFSSGPAYDVLVETENRLLDKNEPRKVWYVYQGSTFKEDQGKKFLWAPQKDKSGNNNFHWDNVAKVKKGDIIFNYSRGIHGISLAKANAYPATNPETTSNWTQNGYKVDIELTELNRVITAEEIEKNKESLVSLLNTIRNKPFNYKGGPNQGYLFEFTPEAGKYIRDKIYEKKFGNTEIDNFFDTVGLDNGIVNQKKTPMADITKLLPAFKSYLKAQNLIFDDTLVTRFISSLATKPFVILTGNSGTGKSKIALEFAKWINGGLTNERYKLIPVGADWTDNRPILGYFNPLVNGGTYVSTPILKLMLDAIAEPDFPHFLILDEMNLSHVERYFSDFLSLIESPDELLQLHDAGKEISVMGNTTLKIPSHLQLPPNLFIIGTVNVDETTYMFSPKVLDRANVIEVGVTFDQLNGFSTGQSNVISENGAPFNYPFLALSLKARGIIEQAATSNKQIEQIKIGVLNFFQILQSHDQEFGFRTLSETLRYFQARKELDVNTNVPATLNEQVVQKYITKLNGSRIKMERLLIELLFLCEKYERNLIPLSTDVGETFTLAKDKNLREVLESPGPNGLASSKIRKMLRRLGRDQFVSFI